jgi:hypothetical protein
LRRGKGELMMDFDLKYEFVGKEDEPGLRQIRALRDIPVWGVNKGDLGGWIGSEECLAQDDESWVGSGASVDSQSKVMRDSLVIESIIIDSRVDSASIVVNSVISKTLCDDSRVADSTVIDSWLIDSVVIEKDVESTYLRKYNMVDDAETLQISMPEPKITILSVFMPEKTWVINNWFIGSMDEFEKWATERRDKFSLKTLALIRKYDECFRKEGTIERGDNL